MTADGGAAAGVGMNACQPFTGPLNNHGYGVASVQGKAVLAHRLAYERARGPIPTGLVLDHLCRNPACCNPDHLEAVTFRENVLRGQAPSAENARKTACPAGHPYDLMTAHGRRDCRRCKSARDSRSKARARAAKAPL